MKIKYLFFFVLFGIQSAFGEVFQNPILGSAADPTCIYWNSNYYYMYSDGLSLYVDKSPHMTDATGIGKGPSVLIFTPPAPYNQDVWAPELKYINGNWYAYFAADDGIDVDHRMYVIKADTQDPTGTWTLLGKIYDPNNDYWAIDGNVIQKTDGTLYFVWSGHANNSPGNQYLYIAPMSNPWTISGSRVLIGGSAYYSWEYAGSMLVNEAPAIIQHNGTINIVYSANGTWTDNYCLGLLANNDGNVLNPGSWTKNSTPIFQTYVGSDGSVYAPGSCTFTKSEDGTQDWILFHTAKYQGAGENREVHAQSFTWTPGYNTPNLGHPVPDGIPLAVPSGESVVSPTTARESHLRLQDGRMITFDCAYPDGSVWSDSESTPGGSWSGWNEFTGTGGFKRLDGMQNGDGTLTLFGVGDNTGIWINWQNSSNGPWAGFQSLGGTYQDLKAFRYQDGRYAVFGMDGYQITVNAQITSNGAWGGWYTFPGAGFTEVSPLLLPDQRFVMFGVGNGTAAWINTQTNANSGWTGWQYLGGAFNSVRAFRYNDGRFSVFAGDGTSVWVNTQVSSNGTWGGWNAIPGTNVITQFDPTKLSDERFSLLSVSGGSIWQNTQTNSGGGWAGWNNLGGTGFSKVDGAQLPDGRMYYFANTPGSPEWFRYQAVSNGIWNTGWTNLGGYLY